MIFSKSRVEANKKNCSVALKEDKRFSFIGQVLWNRHLPLGYLF